MKITISQAKANSARLYIKRKCGMRARDIKSSVEGRIEGVV